MGTPFLKWAGGKRKLVPEILHRLPATCEAYIEPFLGGGAVFLALAATGRVNRAILADTNVELINAWRMVRDYPEALADSIEQWAYDRDVYAHVRGLEPQDPLEAAARMLYLNRTGFNGLYRLNLRGEFNVPFGLYDNPKLVDRDNLRRVSGLLQGAELGTDDFEKVMDGAPRGAVVYCDPPYWPTRPSSSFRGYGSCFDAASHSRLADAFGRLAPRGVQGLLSSAYCDETLCLYGHLPHEIVYAPRVINRDGTGRGAVPELPVRTR